MTVDSNNFEKPRLDISRQARATYRAMVALDASLDLDPALRELVNLRASILNGCAYCIDMHTLDARARGETEQRLYAVSAWKEAPFFSERERAALLLTDSITLLPDSHVPKDVFDLAGEHFDEEQLAQLIWSITVINAWNRIAVATRLMPGEHTPS